MPRPSKGARLWFDKDRGDWCIRDGTKKIRTGCREEDRIGAEKALSDYISSKYEPPTTSRPAALLVDDVLVFYGTTRGDHASKSTTGYAIDALLGFWSGKSISDIKRSTCAAYVAHRTSSTIATAKHDKEALKRKVSISTAARELRVLRAAVNAYHAETPLDALPVVTIPEGRPTRERWLTRKEVAALLRAARRLEDKDGRRLLCRFILLGVYTGTRSGALKALRWERAATGGHINLASGVLHRAGDGEAKTKKRKPPVRLPRRLLAHLRRWRSNDRNPSVLHYEAHPVKEFRKTWIAARTAAGLGKEVTPHVLRHTAVTWLIQEGSLSYEDVGAFVGMTAKMVEEVYGHHHPDFQGHAAEAASRGGRRRNAA